MPNSLYNVTGAPGFHSFGSSAAIRAEFVAIAAGFDKFPLLAGNAGRPVVVNAGETGFDYALPASYLSQATADSLYLKKIGDTASGTLVTALDGIGFKSQLLTNVGTSGVQVLDEAGTRRLELVYFGLGGAGGYGGGAGAAVINAAGSGGLVLSTVDTARIVVDSTGKMGFGGAPGNGLARFVGNYAEFTDSVYRGYVGRGDAIITGAASNDFAISSYNGSVVLSAGGGTTVGLKLDASNNTQLAGHLGVGGSATTLSGVYAFNPADTFTVDTNKVINHYGLAWKTFSDVPSGGTAALSGYGGIRFYAAGVEGARLDTIGNLGIGVVPTYKLDVRSTTTNLGKFSTTQPAGVLRFGSNGIEVGYIGSGTVTLSTIASNDFGITAAAGGVLAFGSNNTEKGRFLTGGALCLGSTSQSGIGGGADQLAVSGTIGFLSQLNGLSATFVDVCNRGAGGMRFFVNGASVDALDINAAGVVSMGGNDVGFKGIPSTGYTDGASINRSAVGYCIKGSYTSLTVPNSVFQLGDAVMIYQDSAGSMTITQGTGVTMRLAGSATTGSRTLAGRGVASLWWVSASEVIVSGAGVS